MSNLGALVKIQLVQWLFWFCNLETGNGTVTWGGEAPEGNHGLIGRGRTIGEGFLIYILLF